MQPNLVVLQGRKAEVHLPSFVTPPKHRDLPAEWQPGLGDARVLLGDAHDDIDKTIAACKGGFVDVNALITTLENIQSLVVAAAGIVQGEL